MNTSSKIIAALDGMTKKEALDLASTLNGQVWGFKVGDLLLDTGVSLLSELKKFGKVFADLKFHDIPKTVENLVSRVDRAGADLLTVHASGGSEMIQAAVKSGASAKIVCVTALTSLSDSDCLSIYGANCEKTVCKLATNALNARAFGIVCSPLELNFLKAKEYAGLAKITPGVRPDWYQTSDDQTRVSTPREAVQNGADLLVIGRPITQHSNPLDAVSLINLEITQ